MQQTKILIVENDGTIIVRLEKLLRSWGYDVLLAGSGEIALPLAEEQTPDLALMDIRLGEGAGEMDGIETAQILRSRFDIPSIYLTAYTDEEFLQRARQTEPYGYLVKPLQELSLRSTLEMATAKLEVDRQLKLALQQKEILMKEILHRTKNNMFAISSLLSLQSAYIKDARMKGIFQETQNRIQSMAMVQEKLYRSEDISHTDLGEYLYDLTYTIFSNYSLSSDTVTLSLDMQSVIVPADTAIPCGLLLNELLTNAIKYAFPDDRTGEIVISLHLLADGMIELGVGDNGIGIQEDLNVENTTSLGLQLVHSFIVQLQGDFELSREHGTRWRIRFQKKSGDQSPGSKLKQAEASKRFLL